MEFLKFQSLYIWWNFWMPKYQGALRKSIMLENFKILQTGFPKILVKKYALSYCWSTLTLLMGFIYIQRADLCGTCRKLVMRTISYVFSQKAKSDLPTIIINGFLRKHEKVCSFSQFSHRNHREILCTLKGRAAQTCPNCLDN